MLCSNCKVLLLGGQGDETLEDKNDQTLEVCCLFLNNLNTIVFFFQLKDSLAQLRLYVTWPRPLATPVVQQQPLEQDSGPM